MKNLSDVQKWKLLVQSDVNQAASDIGHRSVNEAARIADELGVAYMANVVSQLGTDAAADMLRNLPVDFREKIIQELEAEKAGFLREVLAHRPGTAGALMAKEYLAVPIDFTIRRTTDYLQAVPDPKKGKVSYIYVVDTDQRLEGVIQIRDLVFHSPETPVRHILKSPVVQVETGMSQQDVARLLQRHRYLGLPVVNQAQRLVGVVSADSAMQALEDEASDDIAKIVGTSSGEIRASSVRRIIRFRLPWLFVNILSGLGCALIAGVFQRDMETVAALFLFVPVVLGLSESTGVQGATIVVRNLALGNISPRHLSALFFREAIAGIVIGSVCGGVVGAFAMFWKQNYMLGIAIAGSMSLSVICSAVIGLILPLLFKRMKFDPAMASGPLVLALSDIQTLVVYFNLSGFIMGPV